MLKKIYKSLVLLPALALVLAGCGAQGDPQGQAPGESSQEYQLLMATGGTGGTYYPLGGAMAETWKKHIEGLNVTVQSTGASVENLRLLASGETELAMAMNGPAAQAIAGTGDFEGAPIDFVAVGVIYPEVMQIIAPADRGFVDVADLKGKRVSIGPPGSGTASAARTILAAYDIDPDQDITLFQDNFTDAARKLKDGMLDAAFAVLAVPASNVEEITTATDVTIVNIDGEGLEKILADDPTFSPYEIPGGTYKGQDGVSKTISQWAVLYTTKDLPDDLVYEMTKVMYEKASETALAHARGDQILLETALLGIEPVPLHPGAERFYKDVGLLD
ncbi:TAXI family TRAP transporter solute-binding subunit [Heliorestis convoluta]|uniref:TRAP transporter solute receptor, TAXI family protein n=1 Tax=Heliorestis convoluta TaxID=356322 RepID=A0A5Q2MW53_9FIRM|nr:TAXI family TRAP transporter solute-binding subunit [Heliorestis convoluta]QGG46614.1 TRAP transporter solute receptor, TAXI family protein [Heliorestis convoluta]